MGIAHAWELSMHAWESNERKLELNFKFTH